MITVNKHNADGLLAVHATTKQTASGLPLVLYPLETKNVILKLSLRKIV